MTINTVLGRVKEAMTQAYLSGAYTMAEIGDHFGVHSMAVSRAVREFEGTSQEMEECEN